MIVMTLIWGCNKCEPDGWHRNIDFKDGERVWCLKCDTVYEVDIDMGKKILLELGEDGDK